eukprot:s477_g21.t1
MCAMQRVSQEADVASSLTEGRLNDGNHWAKSAGLVSESKLAASNLRSSCGTLSIYPGACEGQDIWPGSTGEPDRLLLQKKAANKRIPAGEASTPARRICCREEVCAHPTTTDALRAS